MSDYNWYPEPPLPEDFPEEDFAESEGVVNGTMLFFNQGWQCVYVCQGKMFSADPEKYEHAAECYFSQRDKPGDEGYE